MQGLNVVVTGASGGIGSMIVDRFLDADAKVIAVDLTESGLDGLREKVANPQRLRTVRCDITSEQDCASLVAGIVKEEGAVAILVNSAGLFPPCSFEDMQYAEWRRIIAVNLDGVFLMSHALLPLMKERGWGRIINIGSSSFFQGTPLYTHYVAAKAGVIGFTRSLAREVGRFGITANVVAPGVTSTEAMLRTTPPALLEDRLRQRSIKRHQHPGDVVGVVAFLATVDADFITGQTINVDGGAVMY
jgi:NAD(P)-dependent dehydrogenase (short-subunit alcohol dehydrogenase family)